MTWECVQFLIIVQIPYPNNWKIFGDSKLVSIRRERYLHPITVERMAKRTIGKIEQMDVFIRANCNL